MWGKVVQSTGAPQAFSEAPQGDREQSASEAHSDERLGRAARGAGEGTDGLKSQTDSLLSTPLPPQVSTALITRNGAISPNLHVGIYPPQ